METKRNSQGQLVATGHEHGRRPAKDLPIGPGAKPLDTKPPKAWKRKDRKPRAKRTRETKSDFLCMGRRNPGTYVMPWGRFIGKTLDEVAAQPGGLHSLFHLLARKEPDVPLQVTIEAVQDFVGALAIEHGAGK